MAIIGKIRKHAGFTVGAVAIAMIGFLFLSDSSFTGCRQNRNMLFAKIDGEKINKSDFDQKIEEQTKRYLQQAKKENLTSAESFQLMLSVWDQFEKDLIMQKEYEKLGLAIDYEKYTKPSISPEELYDLMVGKNLHPFVVQSFTDPNTGQVNIEAVKNYIQNFDQLTDEQRTEWIQFEQAVKDDRLKTKYNNLISKAYYIPKPFLQMMADENGKTASLLSVGVKYQTISDSAVTVTDEDFKKYYEEHKHEYQQEEGRDIDFVVFEPVPSKEDMDKINQKVAKIYEDFQKIENKDIDNFIRANSDAPYDSLFYKKGMLPLKLDSIMFASQVGFTLPPYIEEKAYKIARLVQIQNRPDSIKASQILIAYKGAPNALESTTRLKEQAKAVADSILGVVKKDINSFKNLAMLKSDFSSAKKDAGDLGWMIDGVEDFKFFFDSCLNAKTGDVKIIQSNMGYHVLYIENKKEGIKKVKVAVVSKDIKPSSETINSFQLMANEFAGNNRTAEQFNKSVADKGLNKRTSQYVKRMDYTISGLEVARDVIRWAYDEKTEKGMVAAQVFDNSGNFVVAMLTEKREKGIAPLEQVKQYIEPLVKRDKKAEIIMEKVKNAVSGAKDIVQVAQKLNATVDTINQLTFASYNLPQYGPEPGLIGTIFSLKKNELSEPVKGQMAVYVVYLMDITTPLVAVNTDMLKTQIMSYFRSRIESEVFTAIKDQIKITDNRMLYY